MPRDVGKKETGKSYIKEIPFVRFSACLLSQKRSLLNRGRGSHVETEQLQIIMSLFIAAEFMFTCQARSRSSHTPENIYCPGHLELGSPMPSGHGAALLLAPVC